MVQSLNKDIIKTNVMFFNELFEYTVRFGGEVIKLTNLDCERRIDVKAMRTLKSKR